ncbi:dephospho-CoA kinase [Streptococcus chenjunshii]|uniref:Dephospho-CoA kinase n=1 Tax=Streptococcus chenjunshii TaxID=2173853 RepID=A0A372KNA8_9STRE|nr:dephospho-CoA kinase [Streptococcus chenjunshii]AXQ79113.1 dephospho-CoA kinase [Streptococcus chenjunshii]RFU50311.1 dephospho-CoA kinase [Streptococcus chenjunshii]RFU53404.1 dephospho-CoA kinase [Streptococcus chenjunshii]
MSKVIGITGGIASGKTTVVEEIRRAGYKVIDADQVVHDLQAKGGRLYKILVDWLGEGILNDNGELDRLKLAELIFSSPHYLKKSAQLQNPVIRQELSRRCEQMAQTENIFFMDIPLLIEQDYIDWFDEIWLVYVEKGTQIQRLMARNGYSQEEANKRLASQMPLIEKVAYADAVIDNNGRLENLQKQVAQLLKRCANVS